MNKEYIDKIFVQMGLAEELGTGIRKVFQYRYIRLFVSKGLVERRGSKKTGWYYAIS